MRTFSILLVVTGLLFASCKKDRKIEVINPSVPSVTKPALSVQFKARINNKDLSLSPGERYVNSTPGDTFTVSRLIYYISNVKLKAVDGYTFTEKESYHLVNHKADSSLHFNVNEIPEGYYSSIEFIVGVDSARNVSGAQTGFLDPAYNMFWSWNSGYIFLKIEGEFTSLADPSQLPFAMHIGGYSGDFNCIRKCVLLFPQTLAIEKGKTPQIEIEVNIDKLFSGPTTIGMYSYSGVSGGKKAVDIADNYSKMFNVTKVSN